MFDSKINPRIFISAAEPSADLHGASFIRAVLKAIPNATFAGMTGPMMADAGAECLFDMTAHSAMAAGALANVGHALNMFSTLDRHLGRRPFDAAVLIDSPTLNLKLARRLKARRIPVLYYIAPQTWAWGQSRVKHVRARTDRLAVILPFEERYFRLNGCAADYVGHPLFDALPHRPVDPEFRACLTQSAKPIVTILPGSRKHVVQEVLPGQLQVARRLARRFKHARFLLSVANPRVAEPIRHLVQKTPNLDIDLYTADHNADLIAAADLVLVASGTATLEVAYDHKPMIIMYNSSRIGYQLIGKWLINTPHLSLVNILAGRQLVPEYMPYYTSVAPIAERAAELLASPQQLEKIADQLRELMTALVKTGASANAAAILIDMLNNAPPAKTRKIIGSHARIW